MLLYYRADLGFLIYNIKHEELEKIASITNKCFSLLRFFTKERTDNNKVELSYQVKKETSKKKASIETKALQLTDITEKLLKMQDEKPRIIIFPTSLKKQCYIFHRILLPEPISKEELEKSMYYLRRGYHTSFVYEPCQEDNNLDFLIVQQKNIYWSFCQRAIISLSYCLPGEDNYFVTNQYCNNVRNDYFLLYMMLLHERHALLHYNYIAVIRQRKMKRLERLKRELISFRINFAYKVVSDEVSYQYFYDSLHNDFALDRLNADLQDVIDRVTEYQDTTHEKSMNSALGLIALFSIFSAFGDGISLIDRVNNNMGFTIYHWICIGLVILISLRAAYIFLRNKIQSK